MSSAAATATALAIQGASLEFPAMSPGRGDLVARERRSTGAEQRFRPDRGGVLRQGRGSLEMALGAGMVAGAEGDIGETQDGFRRVFEAPGERQVLPAGGLRLARGQGGGGDRQVVAQDVRASHRVFRRLPGGAAGERNHRENSRGRPHAASRR
ncbi:MAG: hypothetical protein J4F33_13280 [Alphaproteobacteria bacterium]|nr:hypothetical protein [Alphaproteobacteria bacterium]